jgi:hypothetical protein
MSKRWKEEISQTKHEMKNYLETLAQMHLRLKEDISIQHSDSSELAAVIRKESIQLFFQIRLAEILFLSRFFYNIHDIFNVKREIICYNYLGT